MAKKKNNKKDDKAKKAKKAVPAKKKSTAKKKPTPKKPSDKPKKKKAPVGRPKKRGRKKTYYKKKKKKKVVTPQSRKGFGTNASYNRVRSLLWEKYQGEFGSYREFISNTVDQSGKKIAGTSIVSQVYDQCKGTECSDEDIVSIYHSVKVQDKGQPVLNVPSNYYDPMPYWLLVTEDLWDGMDDRIWVYSPMLLDNPDFFLGVNGEDRCLTKDNQPKDISDCDSKNGDRIIMGMKFRFHPFVDYGNQLQATLTSQGYDTETDNVPHIRFMGVDDENPEPYWNEADARWELQIVICNKWGDIESFDFDPTVMDAEFPEDYELPERPTDEPPIDEPTVDTKAIEKEIELEKQKEKTSKQVEKTALAEAKREEKKAVSDLTEMFKKGVLNKKEFMEMLKIVKS